MGHPPARTIISIAKDVLFKKKKHMRVPFEYASAPRARIETYPELELLFQAGHEDFNRFLTNMNRYEEFFGRSTVDNPILDWTSPSISPLDGASIYTMIADAKPARILEIGSGVSTHFMCRAVVDQGLACDISCIDPNPRISISGLYVEFERKLLNEGHVVFSDRLDAGDVLFVDSSHLLFEGFDLDIILNQMLPRLAPGTIVHFHDIFLPFAYPENWSERMYNEQNALGGWLTSGALEVIFPSYYVATRMAESLRKVCSGFPIVSQSSGGSLWTRKISPALRP